MSSLTVGLAAAPAPAPVGSGISSDLIVLIGVVLLVAVFSYLAVVRAGQRNRAMASFAAANGCRYSQSGDLGDTGIPLCERGRSRRWDRCIAGAWKGTSFSYADYQYVVGEGRDQRVVRWSMVRLPLGCDVPAVQVSPRHLLASLVNRVEGSEIDMESIDFNKRYLVTSDARSFAVTLLDPRMMEAILGCADDINIATGSAYLVVYGSPPCRPELLGAFLDEACAVFQRVPAVVRQRAQPAPG
ncbi:MAG: hypothetical protein JOZ92_07345 [Candidatus Dormibacteraeota bacterium]|nr:hypothetical protein [Candidatus Dormibacteraeota bacterium]